MKKVFMMAIFFATQLSLSACSGKTVTETIAAEVETTSISEDSETESQNTSIGATELEGHPQEETAVSEITSNQQPAVTAASQAANQTVETSASSILVVYFSRAENIGGTTSVDAVSSASINLRDGEVVGNMRAMAEVIQELTGGDLFSIQTERTYSPNYRESTNEARAELNSNARPALTTHVEDMSRYDVVYVGYPNWWGTTPAAVSSFLEEYDFSGKTIIPFCSHEGSGLGSGVSVIREICPDAALLDGYEVRGSRAADETTAAGIKDWLNEIGQQIREQVIS